MRLDEEQETSVEWQHRHIGEASVNRHCQIHIVARGRTGGDEQNALARGEARIPAIAREFLRLGGHCERHHGKRRKASQDGHRTLLSLNGAASLCESRSCTYFFSARERARSIRHRPKSDPSLQLTN